MGYTYVKIEADSSVIRSKIAQTLSMMSKHPSTAQVTEAFKSYTDILTTFFAVNDDENLFHVEDISRLSHGQPVWHKCDMMTFPNYFYSDKSLIEQITY